MIRRENIHPELIFTKILDDEDMNNRIINRIDEVGDEQNLGTNNQCLCTNFGMHKQYPEFAQLADEALDFCQLSSDDVCNDFENHKIRLTQPGYNYFIQTLSNTLVWGTRAESGEIVRAHDHWPSVWGWTYYIDPPEGCSNLYFPTLDYELEIEHGMLVAFRGHVIHETRPQSFDGYRYCVAGTLSHLK